MQPPQVPNTSFLPLGHRLWQASFSVPPHVPAAAHSPASTSHGGPDEEEAAAEDARFMLSQAVSRELRGGLCAGPSERTGGPLDPGAHHTVQKNLGTAPSHPHGLPGGQKALLCPCWEGVEVSRAPLDSEEAQAQRPPAAVHRRGEGARGLVGAGGGPRLLGPPGSPASELALVVVTPSASCST